MSWKKPKRKVQRRRGVARQLEVVKERPPKIKLKVKVARPTAKATTPLASAFRVIRPWRRYLEYVALGAQSGDTDMKAVMGVYDSLPPKEQKSVMPERLCSLSGIPPEDLIAGVVKQLWICKQGQSQLVAAVAQPMVFEAVARFA